MSAILKFLYSHSYLLYSSAHPSHVTFHSFSDFVVYVVTTLIFPKKQEQSASFSINVAILFLSFKWVTTTPNQIDRQSALVQTAEKENADRIPFTLSFLTLTTTQLNLSFSKTLNHFKTIERLVLSFRNIHQFHSNVTKT